MNAEQKQAARNLIDDFKDAGNEWDEAAVASHMTALLQELVEAPEVEPALVVEVEPDYWHRGHYCEGSKPYINPLEVWKLPVGTKLYTAPPAPSVLDEQLQEAFDRGLKAGNEQKDLQQAEIHRLHDMLDAAPTPAPSVPELEEYDAGALNDFGGGNVGWWQDYIRSELGRAYEFYCSQLSAAPTPADLVRDAARYRWILNQAWFQQAADRFDLPDGGLQKRFEKCMDAFADAAIERDKLKGQS